MIRQHPYYFPGIQDATEELTFVMPGIETPALAEMIASFDLDRHCGEVMVTEPVGVERMLSKTQS